MYHSDIRTQGSGNPGFTNFKRVYGGFWAWVVFVLDIGKGLALFFAFGLLFHYVETGEFGALSQFGCAYTGFFAMLGHAYPVWYRFKGGKCFLVVTTLVWFLDWRSGLVALGVMLLVLTVFRFMSLSSICSLLSAPISLFCFGTRDWRVLALCAVCVLFVVYRHRANIVRLCKGTESRFSFKKKKE